MSHELRKKFIDELSQRIYGNEIFKLPVNLIAFIAQETLHSLSIAEEYEQKEILFYDQQEIEVHFIPPTILKEIEYISKSYEEN